MTQLFSPLVVVGDDYQGKAKCKMLEVLGDVELTGAWG